MAKNKSIGTRLKKVRSCQKQKEILLDWSENWKDDQSNTLKRLRLAAVMDNHGEIMHAIDQLEGLTEKRFTALNNVINTISDPDRKLKDLRECGEVSEESPAPDDVSEE